MSRSPIATVPLHAPRPLRRTQDRLAKIYDDEVYPLWGQRFADMLMRAFQPPPRASVLELGCGAGAMTAEILHRLDGESRVVALDASPSLLDRARARVGQAHAGRRVFFRHHDPAVRLPFAEETYELVLANFASTEAPDLSVAVADLARVTRPGGQVSLTLPLRGTWAELIDLYKEVLVRLGRRETLEALETYVAAQPEGETVARALEAAGLMEVEEELASWELLFRSGREFFYAPVIEHGPLPRWKTIAGKGEAMQEIFFALKEAIDTYYVGHAFSVGVFGGRFSGRKPAAESPGATLGS
jgi:ubiquinone/menaquinone biosynthesis C-methylase UbiE